MHPNFRLGKGFLPPKLTTEADVRAAVFFLTFQLCDAFQSLVVNNVYKETYVIFLLYEHVFSLLYEDGSSVNTRHRLLRVLDTPLLCRPPFSLDRMLSSLQRSYFYTFFRPTFYI